MDNNHLTVGLREKITAIWPRERTIKWKKFTDSKDHVNAGSNLKIVKSPMVDSQMIILSQISVQNLVCLLTFSFQFCWFGSLWLLPTAGSSVFKTTFKTAQLFLLTTARLLLIINLWNENSSKSPKKDTSLTEVHESRNLHFLMYGRWEMAPEYKVLWY